MYTCVTTNPVSSIQANFTLILQGLSPKDVAIVAALTAGQLISAPSLRSAVLPDQWRWKTLGALLGIAFYFLILFVCNSLSVTATYVAFIYWIVFKGLSPLDFVVVAVLIIGLQISSFYIRTLWYVDEIWESLQGSRAARIWLKCSALYEAVLISCLIVAFIVNAAISGFSATGTVTLALAIIVPLVFILIPVYLDMRRNLKAGDSIKDALIFALKLTLWSLPFVNVIYLVYQLCKKSDTGLSYWSWRQSFQNSIVNMAFFISITLSDFIAGFSSKDTVTFAVSIAMAVLVLVLVISFVFLWQNLFQYYGKCYFPHLCTTSGISPRKLQLILILKNTPSIPETCGMKLSCIFTQLWSGVSQ
ncbi:uncharacterized protein LOC127585778 [Pristis pectinata]|uniref:uncharacterized protein LOC127585778 n=1 Tax=Pristis pectinata TaxID=685728 RepID=UPI00223DF575|nr:uncharacterized protein LOC127585778 [Pristis pectinata]